MFLRQCHRLIYFLFYLLSLVEGAFAFQKASADADFSLIKSRVTQELLKPEVTKGEIEEVLSLMLSDGAFSDINYTDLSRTAGFPHRRHTQRLVALSRAYLKKASPYHESQQLLESIIRSLNHWVNHDFFGDNWHNNQITTPTNLVNVMLLVGDELPSDLVDSAQPIIGRAHMNASGARPSGDRIVIAGILAKNLLFTGDRKKFDEIIRIIEGEIKFSTGQRGMQHDYSFHHRTDRVNNTVSYGYGKYANAFGEWSYYVAGTAYAFSVEKINHLIDYYLDGIFKQLVYGIYPDISVKNRSISHPQYFEPKGTLEIERLLLSTDYRKDELEEIIQLRKGKIKPSKSFCKFFWQTEHFVFQRPDFYTTVRMYSTRNQNMEVPYNGPGKTTHHRADGTNYLVRRGDEYLNIWPVYDWQKISGATIMQKETLPGPEEIRKEGLTNFVGAVHDSLYGAVAYDFRSSHDGLTARKSWFFFDEEYICLGAAIRSNPKLPVITALNQTLSKGPVTVSSQQSKTEIDDGFYALKNINWVHHDGIAYFPIEPATIQLSNQIEQGRWSDITDQKNISTDVVEKVVFALWIDHGASPDSSSYAYMVVPDVSTDEIQGDGLENRGIDILSNTRFLQAVQNAKLGICQMAFYRAGSLAISPNLNFEMSSQGMAMIKMEDGVVAALTVADPSRKLTQILITVTGNYRSSDQACQAHFDPNSSSTSIIIDLPQGHYLGKSVTVGVEKR